MAAESNGCAGELSVMAGQSFPEIQRIHLLCKVNIPKMKVRCRSQKCVSRMLPLYKRHGNSPHSDVVVDRLRVDDGEVDVDAVTRRNPDCPHAVLEVWILGRVSGRINRAIHGCYIPTAERWREEERIRGTDRETASC